MPVPQSEEAPNLSQTSVEQFQINSKLYEENKDEKASDIIKQSPNSQLGAFSFPKDKSYRYVIYKED